jgi:hypothetical protein
MPHVDTITLRAGPSLGRTRRVRFAVDPAWWAWAAVALMALLPLHAALGTG